MTIASPASAAQRTVVVASTLSNSGLLQLNQNDLIVRNADATGIAAELSEGFNGGRWNGTNGIAISSAAANTGMALGILLNTNAAGTALKSTFDGQSVSQTDVLVKYTYYGDANLDGKVDASDYSLIDSGYLTHVTGWYNGDFNYDGVINGSDYTLIDNAFNTQSVVLNSESAATTSELAEAGGSQSVPEPGSLGILFIAATGLLGRRRR